MHPDQPTSPPHTQSYVPPTPTGFITTEPAPAPKRSRLPWIIAIAAGAGFVILAIVIAAMLATGRPTPTAGSNPAGISDVGEEALPDPAPTTEAPGPVLKASDVKLTLKTVDKECYGSAGCSLVVRVQAAHAGGKGSFKSPDTWLVTYEITGGADGPQVGSFEITGGEYTQNEEFLSTKSKSTVLKVKVTDVEKVGI